MRQFLLYSRVSCSVFHGVFYEKNWKAGEMSQYIAVQKLPPQKNAAQTYLRRIPLHSDFLHCLIICPSLLSELL